MFFLLSIVGFDAHKRNKRREIQDRSWFSETSTNPLAAKLPSLLSHCRKRKTDIEDDKNDWKKSVLVKPPSADDKCGKTLSESELEIPRLGNDDQDEGTGHSVEQTVQGDDSLRNKEITKSHSDEMNYNASKDKSVLASSTPFVSDTSSKLVTGTNHNNEEAGSSRDFYEQASLTHDKPVLSRESSSKKDGFSSLVSSLYSSGSSDDDLES